MQCAWVSAILGSVLGVGCGREPAPAHGRSGSREAPAARFDAGAGDAGPAQVTVGAVSARTYDTLTAALEATIPADARVIGFGELHARVDRAAVTSALAGFTAVLPAFAARLSDLVVETWIVDPRCGPAANQATVALETVVARPAATKSEIALLADAARAGQVQPHAMTLTCKDYERLAPKDGEPDAIEMLTITTRELARVATSALTYRARERGDDAGLARPWVALYGGALHNDRFPAAGVAEWSYADTLDLATDGHFVEIDLIVRALATEDASSQRQPWFALLDQAPDRALVWERGERSFVVVLPR